jgi:hypothetical protein
MSSCPQAGRTAKGFIGVAFRLQQLLLFNRENKVFFAIHAVEYFFFMAHLITSTTIFVGLAWDHPMLSPK